jgi:hypothetical protein
MQNPNDLDHSSSRPVEDQIGTASARTNLRTQIGMKSARSRLCGEQPTDGQDAVHEFIGSGSAAVTRHIAANAAQIPLRTS